MHKALRPFGSNLLLACWGRCLTRTWVTVLTQRVPGGRDRERLVWSEIVCATALVKMGRLENLPCSFQLHILTAKYLHLLWAIACSLCCSVQEVTAVEKNQVRRKGAEGFFQESKQGLKALFLLWLKSSNYNKKRWAARDLRNPIIWFLTRRWVPQRKWFAPKKLVSVRRVATTQVQTNEQTIVPTFSPTCLFFKILFILCVWVSDNMSVWAPHECLIPTESGHHIPWNLSYTWLLIVWVLEL